MSNNEDEILNLSEFRVAKKRQSTSLLYKSICRCTICLFAFGAFVYFVNGSDLKVTSSNQYAENTEIKSKHSLQLLGGDDGEAGGQAEVDKGIQSEVSALKDWIGEHILMAVVGIVIICICPLAFLVLILGECMGKSK